MYYTFDMIVRMSGLNLCTHLLCLQKCLTVSHHLGEQGASTKITMKVSSDYCLVLFMSVMFKLSHQ